MISDIMFLFNTGGPVVAVLAAISVVALTMSLYKIWQFAVNRVGRHKVALQAIDLWLENSRQEAYDMVASHRSPLSKVVAHAMRGLTHANTNIAAVREDVTRVALAELHELRRYLRGIEVIAQSAPLLGLLGTVIGMIEAFNKLAGSGTAVNPALLAGGIWTALLATAMGLGVALVFSTLGAWFESIVENERSVVELTMTGFFAQRIADDQGRDFGDVTKIETKRPVHAN